MGESPILGGVPVAPTPGGRGFMPFSVDGRSHQGKDGDRISLGQVKLRIDDRLPSMFRKIEEQPGDVLPSLDP